jgi:hypothetical protein
MQYKNCKVCLMEHDPEIHDATLRLHEWLRDRVKESIQELEPVEASAA